MQKFIDDCPRMLNNIGRSGECDEAQMERRLFFTEHVKHNLLLKKQNKSDFQFFH